MMGLIERAAGRRAAKGITVGREAGQAAVELALVLPLLVLILMLIVDFGRVFTTYVALTNAAREGARYCALQHVRPPASAATNTAGTQDRVQGELDGRIIADTTATECLSVARGQPVTVTVRATFSPLTPFITELAGGPITVQAPATMVVW